MYKNSRKTVLFPLLLAAGVLTGLFAGQMLGRTRMEHEVRNLVSRLHFPDSKLSYTLALIDRKYVDSLSLDTLTEHLLPRLVEELDPHSVYIPAQDLQSVNEPLEGEFDGIGVVFNMATDTVIVLNVIPGGPSDRAGVCAGDRIMTVGDSLIAGRKIPQDRVVKMLRGPRGSKVRLGLSRRQIGDLVKVEVTRAAIPLKSVETAFMVDDRTGYLRLSQFARTSYDEVTAAIASLREQGMKGLVFDLRGNSGGYLDQAILIANELLPEGRLIVYTENRRREQMREYSDGAGSATEIALAVLIDEYSASSSEILAGAIQDNDRGTILGRRSFGKGLVQEQIPFADGSALRLTTARYFTPTGRSIQKPYRNGDQTAYAEEMYQRYRNNELFSADSIHFADSLRFTTPGGRTVYGGGGIMPDIFIPVDTTDVTRYYIEVSGRNILYRYTIDYADRHREALDGVRTLADLKRLLDGDRGLVDDFVAYAARHGVAPVPRDIARSRPLIEAQLRAYIGRNTVLEDQAFYANIYPVDKPFVKAVEILEQNR